MDIATVITSLLAEMNKLKFLPYCILTIIAFSCKTASHYSDIFDKYENIKQPVSFVSTLALPGNTYKGCFSNDYSTFYFFRHHTPNTDDYRIFQSTFRAKKWGEPDEINFSDMNSDLYPMISTKQQDKLFFSSYRRTPTDTSQKTNSNFWYTIKTNNSWGKPVPFEQADLIYNYNSQPCITNSGNIYFTSNTPDWSKTLTYMMKYNENIYEKPVPFDFVNQLRDKDSATTFWEICVAPDETYMIMTISEKGKPAKLHLSVKINEKWQYPVYIGDIIKEDMSGNFPYITKDGKFLLFTRAFSSFYVIPVKTFIQVKH